MIIWIDGPFGAGKTAIAEQLKERRPVFELISFDEYIKTIEPINWVENMLGKRYPEDKKYYINAFAKELERKIQKERLVIVPIALITDYCRVNLVEHFAGMTRTGHIILCVSKDKLIERISNQEGRDTDLALTYYAEASLYLKNHYQDAIRIDTDKMTIEEVTTSIERIIDDWR